MNSNKFKCCGGTINPDSGISVYDWAIKDNTDIIPKNKLPEFYSKDEVDLLIEDIEQDGVEIINGDWYINGQYAGRATGPKGDKGDPGDTPYIQNDYWYINGTNTLIKAVGLQGPQGKAFTYEDFTEEQLLALKGEPGKDGKDGKDGADGKDGSQTEYIYALSNSETAPSRPSSLNVDNYCPVGWSTVPQQISELYKFLYISSRNKINGTWGEFSIPVLFSRYAEKGATGGHYEFRYKNSEKQPTKPIGNGIGNGWTREPSTPTDGEFTWMSQALCQDNNYGEWSEPIRITGDTGKDGEDGKSFEFIYINYTPGEAGAYPSISYDVYIDDNGIEQNPNNDDFVPRGWTDNPTGVSEKNQYEWFSTREKVKGVWSQFSFPVIWSKWGEKGQDGDGYEYIYLLSNTEPDNPTPSDYETNNNYLNLDEYVKLLSGWTDEPQGVSEEYLIEWVSVRRRKNSKWLPFSKPAEWARWSSKGTDGGHWVFAYTVSKTTPLILPDGSDLKGWTYAMPENIDRESGYGIYMTLCFVSSSGVYGIWSTPIRISGEDGKPGTDGNFTEFIYTRTAKDSTTVRDNLILLLELLTNSSGIDRNEDGFIPDGWFDHPQGVDELNYYEWVSTRTRKGTNTWGNFSTPVIWSKWGEKGMDGDGYEYVFFVTPEQVVPELNSDDKYNGKTKDDDEYLPYASERTIRWFDNPQDVSEVNQYEWVSVRKKHKGVWGEFESPKLWTRWAPKGGHYEFRYKNDSTQPSPPTGDGTTDGWNKEQISPDIKSGIYTWMSHCYIEKDSYDGVTWSSPIRITGEDGVDGTDGKEIEFIYTLTKTNDSFNAPTIDDDETIALDDWPNVNGDTPSKTINGITWSDNPKGVTDQWMYEWVCTRTKRNGVWSTYSPPAIWSKWGEKGMDGDGYEYAFKTTLDIESIPTISYNNYNGKTKQDDDFIPEGWTDNPSGISEENPFEWVSKRKKVNGVWGNFSEPVIWSRWAYDGINGGHWVFAYKNSATQPPTPEGQKTLSELDGWSESIQSPDVKNGIFTWMTLNFVTDGNNYGDWSEPVRITGDNGIDGTDGTLYEYIYSKTKTNDRPSIDYDEYTDSNNVIHKPTDDDFVPEGWSDNPQGVDKEYQYEWVAVRKKTNKETWSVFGTPALWSKWSEKGMDGDSFEYIYHLSNKSNPEDITNPTPNDWEDETSIYQNVEEYVNELTDWSDDPLSPNQQNLFVYVCKRTRKYDSSKEKSLWTKFSNPSLWARYAEKGDQGPHYEFRYKNAATQPDKPTGNGTTDGWSATASTPEKGNYTWMSQALANPSDSSYTYDTWTEPIRITGDDGADGTDGTTFEFIYTRNNTGVAPTTPTTSQEDDYIPSGWTDNPAGVTASLMYEYVSTRSKSNGTWSAFSTPAVWSKWGEKGMDGDGYEYIFKLTATNDNPGTPADSPQTDDYIPTGWSDDPESVTQSLPYQWCSVRKKTNGIWDIWSTPALWARYAEQGETGGHYEFRYKNDATQPAAPTETGLTDGWSIAPTNPDVNAGIYTWMSQSFVTPGQNSASDSYGTWTTPIRITGGKGEHGADGTDVEFIYTRNNTGEAPAAPTGKNNEDDWSGTVDGITWTDNPQGVTMDIMYEYVSMRTKKSGESWSNYSTPVIWSKWGEKGMDGDGYEYVYKLSETAWENAIKPPYPTDWETNINYQQDGYIPEGWLNNPESISADMPYLYVCVRKKKNGVWQEFSNAKLWLHWSEGIPGPQGDPGSSPYFANIDNEMDSVACDLNGYTIENYDAYIYVHVWHGSTEEDLTKLTINNSVTNFTITTDMNNKRIRVQVQSGKQIAQVNTINITIASADSGDKLLHFVLNGIRTGDNGDPAVVYSLVPSVSNVTKKKDGSYSVLDVSCTRLKNVGGVITDNITDGRIYYKLDDGITEYPYNNGELVSVTLFSKSIQFVFEVNYIIVDVENIPMIYDGTDGTDGNDGLPGNDAVNVSLSPEEVIVTQSTTYPYNIDLSNAKTVVSVNEGGVPKTIFSITNITGMYCTASNTGNNTIKITGINLSSGTYYDNGYVTFDVIYNGKTYNKRFNFYANLLGTWKRSVEAGVETVVAGLTQYLKDDNGNIITSKSLRNDINNATQDLSTLSQTVITQGQNIQSYNTRLSTAEQNISTIQRNAITRNLLNRGKWFTNDNNFPYADYDAANDRWYDGDHSVDDIYSPVVNLKKGKYCFYGYIPSGSNFDIYGNYIQLVKGATSTNPSGNSSITPSDTGGISTDTIIINNKTYERWYAVFNLDEDSKCSVNLYGDANHSDIAVPCLCEGEHPNIDSSTSMIKQTADEISSNVNNRLNGFSSLITQTANEIRSNVDNRLEGFSSLIDQKADLINLSIRNDLGKTGININGNNRTITAKADNFKIQNSEGTDTFTVSNSGDLVANGGSITSIAEGKGKWEIAPYSTSTSVAIPAITGYDKNNTPKIRITFDGDSEDATDAKYGGGCYFIEDNTFVSGYLKNKARVACKLYGKNNTYSTAEIRTEESSGSNDAIPLLELNYSKNSNYNQVVIGSTTNGIKIYSGKWPALADTTTTGRVYIDANGYLKVKDHKQSSLLRASTNTYLDGNYETVVATQEITLTLPFDAVSGKKYTVIPKSSCYISIGKTNDRIIHPDGSQHQSINISGPNAHYLVYDSVDKYWYLSWCN